MSTISLPAIMPLARPQNYKAHFAIYNGRHHPLDVFLRDRNEWDNWNRYRGQKDEFNRAHILSWMNFYPERNTWLFGGIYDVLGQQDGAYLVARSDAFAPMIGRLKVIYKPKGRNMRTRLENHFDEMIVSELLREPYSGATFRGYEDIDLSFEQLEIIFLNDKPDWRGALENVKGIYLVTDLANGRKYVGSAYGEHGIWSRWRCYIETGHGWNDELTALLREKGRDYARQYFKFTLLEYRSRRVEDIDIVRREAFWKQALLTRTFGYNLN